MSMQYWSIEGIGIEVSQLEDRIDEKKFKDLVKEKFPDDYEEIIKKDGIDAGFLVTASELFYHCDETELLTWANDGDGQSYLLYPRRFFWERAEGEPTTIEEVEVLICNAVKRITNLTDTEIKELIDYDLEETGMG